MKNLKPPNSLSNNFSLYLLTFFILILITPFSYALSIDEKIDMGFELNDIEKLIVDKNIISEIKLTAPILEKTIIENDVIVKNKFAKIKFLNKEDVDLTRVAISDKLISVTGEKDTQARITLYTGLENTILGIYKYEGITNNRGVVLEEGELYTLVKTDSEGKTTFRNIGFSTLTYALPDPIYTGIESSRIKIYDLHNYSTPDYDFLSVLIHDDKENNTFILKSVSYNPDYYGGTRTSDFWITDNWGLYLWKNADETGFELELRTRTINTSYNETIEFDLIVGNWTSQSFDEQDDITWDIGDVNETQSHEDAPEVATSFDETYYFELGEDETLYFADMEVYFNNFTSIHIYGIDYRGLQSYDLGNISIGSNDNGAYTQDWIQFLAQDYESTIDLEVNNNNGADDEEGDSYDVTVRAYNTFGYTDQEFNIIVTGEEDVYNFTYEITFDNSSVVLDTYGGSPATTCVGVVFNINDNETEETVNLTRLFKTSDADATNWYLYNGSPLTPSSGDACPEIVASPLASGTYSGIYGTIIGGQIINVGKNYTFATDGGEGTHTMVYGGSDLPTIGNSTRVTYTLGLSAHQHDDYLRSVQGIEYIFGEGELIEVAPQQIASFATPFILNGSEYLQLGLNGFFANYTNVSISFEDDIQFQTGYIEAVKNGGSSIYNYDHIVMDLSPTYSNVYYNTYAQNWEFSTIVNISVSNNYGLISALINITTLNYTEEEPIEGAPTQTANFATPFTIYYDDTLTLSLGGFFTNYTNISINFEDNIEFQTGYLETEINGSVVNYTYDHIIIQLEPTETQIKLNIFAQDEDFNTTINIIVINEAGNITESIFFSVIEEPTEVIPNGIVATMFASLESFFPDEEDLTLKTQLLYVIVSMLFTAIVLGVGIFTVQDELIKKLLLLAVGILLILEVFFFVANGYIPVIVLVLISLGASLILYAIFRQTT